MSSKSGSAVAERRIRPLWDAIDSRQYKTALKLATSLISKHPDSVYLLVLKALVLERMGKPEEALPLCEQAKSSGPIDDLTLSTLQIVYQRLNQSNQATLCYEHACAKVPNTLELMMGLFNCYVRDYSFLKQQQVAMKMYKIFGEERFLLWAVCSIQLQVFCGNKDRALLSLAEALLKKKLDSQGFEELEALLVYLSLLQDEKKYEAALDVFASKSGELFSIITDKLKLEGKLLLLSCQYERAAKVFQQVLEISSDDWASLLHYLDAILEIPAGDTLATGSMEDHRQLSNGGVAASGLSNEEAEARLQSASVFIRSLQNKDHDELRRGPFLGTVEIEKRCFLLGLGSEKASTLADKFQASLIDYFERFGNMVSFASDIQGYLDLMKTHCSKGFLQRLNEASANSGGESPVRLLRTRISLFQMEMHLDSKATSPDRDVILQALDIVKLYVEGLKLSKDLDIQESMHGEELITLAATCLVQLFLRTRHPGYVVEAIALLEFGLTIRKYSVQPKLMLISLYSTAFCSSVAFEWYKTLDVKNILVETISHHMLSPLNKSMLWLELECMLHETTKFHEDYAKEAADLTILAYKHCNYSKVVEFVQFKDRLHYSHNLLLSTVESFLLQLKQKACNLDEVLLLLEKSENGVNALNWGAAERLAALSFNEGLETRPWWSPAPEECMLTDDTNGLNSWEHKEPQLRQEEWRQNLCKRCLVPRLVYLSLIVADSKEENSEGSAKSRVDELKHLLGKFAQCLGLTWEKLLKISTDISSIRSYIENRIVEVSDLFSLVLFWTSYQILSQSCNEGIAGLNDMAQSIITRVTRIARISDIKSWKPSHAEMVESWSVLPCLVVVVTEGFTWYTLCLQMWLRCLQQSSSSTKTSKKKKKGASAAKLSEVSADGSHAAAYAAVQLCADVFCDHLGSLILWLTSLSKAMEANYANVCKDLLEEGRLSTASDAIPAPGLVLHALEASAGSTDDLGERINAACNTWQRDTVVSKMIESQCSTLRRLCGLLSSMTKALQSEKS